MINRYRSNDIDYTTQEYEEMLYNHIISQIQIDQQQGIITSIRSCVESHFSFIRWDSTTGLTERKVAKEFPESSVFSVGPSEKESDVFMELCDSEEITNAWRFISPLSSTIASHIAESPELFRYQVRFYFFHSILHFHTPSHI